MNNKPLLSISMLVSDRPDTIRRCLDSLKPLMEKIPSELILVRTGKNEQVRGIIKEYTDKIVDFEWCDDFAKARNAGLKLATGEWFLTLDDDEWFVEFQPLIDFFESGEYKKYGCANYMVRNFYDTNYQHYSDAWVSRMIRISKDTHYESKIHEYLYPVEGECKNIEALAYHSGYIFEDEEERQAHFKRNAQLLTKMIEEEPKRLRWRVQLLQEYRSIHDYEHMYEEGMRCIELFRDNNNSTDNRDIGTFYVAAAEGKLFLDDYDEAYRVGALAINDPRTNELCHAYVMLLYSVIFYHKENWKEARHAINTYFQIKNYLEHRPDRLEIQRGALLVGEAFDDMALKRIYSIRIVCGLKRKDTNPLKQYFKELEWDQDSVYLMDGFMSDLVEAMATLKEDKVFVDILIMIWNHPRLKEAFLMEAAPYEQHDPRGFAKLVHYLAQLKADHWYLWYSKICDADEQVSDEEFMAYIHELSLSISNIFYLPDKVIGKAQKRKITLEDIYLQVPLEKWEQDWRVYAANNNEEIVKKTVREIRAIQTVSDIRYDLLEVMDAEYEAFHHEESTQDYMQMRQRLEHFAELTMGYVQKYPGEQKELGEVAEQILEALKLEAANPQEAIQRMAEISRTIRGYASTIKKYLLAFNDYYQNRKTYAQKEMEKLKVQVLMEVQKNISRRDYTAALMVLEQLAEMIPADLDIAELIVGTRILYIKQQG